MTFISTRSVQILALVFVAFLITACGGGESSSKGNGKLNFKIFEALKEDNTISKAEWAEISDFIAKDAEKFAECPCNTDAGLYQYILDQAEKRGKDVPTIEAEIASSGSKVPAGDLKFKLYMESSASMYPYTKGASEFKSAIYNLLTRLSKNGEEEGLINYIGKVIFPVKESVRDFISKSDPYDVAKANKKEINTAVTDLNDILKLIFETGDANAIHILVSDCIYSVKGGDSRAGLSQVKYITKDIIQEYSSTHSVLVLQLKSDYNGTYYAFNNQKIRFDGERPYYMVFIGKTALMNKMLNEDTYAELKDFKSLEGFENSHLFNADQNNALRYSVLPMTEKIGRFKTDRYYSDRDAVRGIKDVEADKSEGTFQFSIAVDLSAILAENSYKTDTDNYTIESTDDFSISKISKIDDDLRKSDRKFAEDATHLIVVNAEEVTERTQALKIGLKKTLPSWITSASIDNDSKMSDDDDEFEGKTFGLKYLMEGIDEGYNAKSDDPLYFELSINIKD